MYRAKDEMEPWDCGGGLIATPRGHDVSCPYRRDLFSGQRKVIVDGGAEGGVAEFEFAGGGVEDGGQEVVGLVEREGDAE